MRDNLRRKVLWGFAVLAILCPCGLFAVGYYAFRSLFAKSAASLPLELRLARKEGIPLEPDDLRPHPPVPDKQNAATIYRAFFPHVNRVFDKHRKLSTELGDLAKDRDTPDETADIEAALDEAHESLVEIAAATRRPFCDFQYHYEDGPMLSLPEMGQAKNAAKLLDAKAHLLGRQGKVAEACDVLASTQRLAVHMGRSPLFIGVLVQISIELMANRELCVLIDRSWSSPTLQAKEEKTLDGFGPPANFREAFGSEVVMGRIAVHMVKKLGDVQALADLRDSGGQTNSSGGPELPDWVRQGFEAKFLEAWRHIFEALPAGRSDWYATYSAAKKADLTIESDRALSGRLNQVLFPELAPATLAVGRQIAIRRITATALKLLRDRLATGSFPAALPNYGAVSTDPFDGKPLRYRKKGAGFTLYSIDEDFHDDGGTPRKDSHGDLVQEFQPTPYRLGPKTMAFKSIR